ncbi:P-loop nucleoside triphosphate hydrolase superfamily protein [Medicago truncatula]|uniref:P-loop nucleoside triphosphate hydrolase superfamily protein n=1 Tax=Medicago truncatula TaxID=3880 RepID=G7I5Z3_MEDTR|nr:P-loop nucleoside triphosphate hydrolase superfamily protein [Medicago truncatula]
MVGFLKHGDMKKLHLCGTNNHELQKTTGSDEILVKSSFLAELQRRVLKAEAALREKDEENDILNQRIQQYENRWSEYELKMKSMEDLWLKQMRSLQSSLSIAKKSLAIDDSDRNSDASVNNASDERDYSWEVGSNHRSQESNGTRSTTASLSVISRLAEAFAKESSIWLKQMFEAWKRDYRARLRETKLIINKLGTEDSALEKMKKKWWG